MPVVADHTAALLGAIRTRVIGVAGIYTTRSWENVDFEPVLHQPYLEDAWMGGPERAADMGDAATLTRGRYTYMLKLVVPAGFGIHEVLKLADKVSDALRGTSLTIAGSPHPARVVIVRTGPKLAEHVNWYSLPIAVSVDMDF